MIRKMNESAADLQLLEQAKKDGWECVRLGSMCVKWTHPSMVDPQREFLTSNARLLIRLKQEQAANQPNL